MRKPWKLGWSRNSSTQLGIAVPAAPGPDPPSKLSVEKKPVRSRGCGVSSTLPDSRTWAGRGRRHGRRTRGVL
jgi:hypothetical protein